MKSEQPNLEVMKPAGGGAVEAATVQPTYMDIMAKMANNLKTPEDVSAFKSLVELDERMKDKQAAEKAKREFNMAFARLQKEIPRVRADKAVEKDGRVLYNYASYQEIMAQVQPVLTANGFSIRFSQELADGRVTYTCHLIHEGGHSESTQYTVRSGRGAPGMNETKEDAAASSVAQRECLCDALNIIRVGRDSDDPRNVGQPITAEQAKSLLLRVEKLQLAADKEVKLLKWLGVETTEPVIGDYQRIMSTKLKQLEDWLVGEEAKKK